MHTGGSVRPGTQLGHRVDVVIVSMTMVRHVSDERMPGTGGYYSISNNINNKQQPKRTITEIFFDQS
jgi:hypothetical protein